MRSNGQTDGCDDTNWRVFCDYVNGSKNKTLSIVAGIAQSVWRLSTGSTVRGSNPGGRKIFHTCSDRP